MFVPGTTARDSLAAVPPCSRRSSQSVRKEWCSEPKKNLPADNQPCDKVWLLLVPGIVGRGAATHLLTYLKWNIYSLLLFWKAQTGWDFRGKQKKTRKHPFLKKKQEKSSLSLGSPFFLYCFSLLLYISGLFFATMCPVCYSPLFFNNICRTLFSAKYHGPCHSNSIIGGTQKIDRDRLDVTWCVSNNSGYKARVCTTAATVLPWRFRVKNRPR